MEQLKVKYEDLFKRERELIKAKLVFYRETLIKMHHDQTTTSSICIEKRLEFEFGKQDFIIPSSFISKIKKRIEQEEKEIEESRIRESSITNFLLEIEGLMKTNPRDMKNTLISYCKSNGLDYNDFNQRLNVSKINAIASKIWVTKYSEIESLEAEKLDELSFENEQIKLFEKSFKYEKLRLKYQVEITADFYKGVRRDKHNSPDSTCDYGCYSDKLFNIYSKTLEEKAFSTLGNQQVLELRTEAINRYIKLAIQTFSDNIDATLEQINNNKNVRTLSSHKLVK